MLRERAKLIIAANCALELGLAWAGFRLAYTAYAMHGEPGLASLPRYNSLFLLTLFSWSVVLWFTPSFFPARVRSIGWVVRRTLLAGLLSTLLVFAGVTVLKLIYVSRGLALLSAAITTALLATERVAVRLAVRWARHRGHNYRQVLIVGVGGAARRVARVLDRHAGWGLRIVGFFAPDGRKRPSAIQGRPVLGGIRDLPSYLTSHVVDEVIFCVPRQNHSILAQTFLTCEELGIRTRFMLNFFPRSTSRVSLEEVDGLPMLTFSRTPASELELAAKRVIDVLCSAIALAVLSPLLAAVALAIRLESPGPVLFRQRRVGLYGRTFTLFKYRSMVHDAEARRSEVAHLNEMDGPVFKVRRDPRVTRLGKYLRRLSLDELPQLFNVLRGEMSLVGPRPPVPEEVDRYQAWQRRRLSVKPGLTCLWQISGRNEVGFSRWMRMDLEYIDNWSIGLDFKILARTVPVVLGSKGAW